MTAGPLVVACPACGTRFRVSSAQRHAAAGRVRCGACLEVFDAVEHAIAAQAPAADGADADGDATSAESGRFLDKNDDAAVHRASPGEADVLLGQADATPATVRDDGGRVPAALNPDLPLRFEVVGAGEWSGSDAANDPRQRRRTVLEDSIEPGLDASQRSQFDVLAAAIEQQSFEPERSSRRGWWIALGILLMVVGQALYFRIDTWSSDPRIRPVYEVLCGALGCRVPLYFDPAAMRSRNVLVRAHPDRSELLLVDVEIVNTAPYPQAFPQMKLALLGRDGREIGSRIFEPADYRSGELATMADVPPNTPLQIAVEMFRPRGEVAQFHFELLPQRDTE